MLEHLPKNNSYPSPSPSPERGGENLKLSDAVISTLAFFSLYELPLSAKRVHELLLQQKATLPEVESELANLRASEKITQQNNLYSIKSWNPSTYNANNLELTKKWAKIDRYFNWLAVLPFVRNISVINSLALGTADSDSDIDFFVITAPGTLYFVRSMIIVLFRLLGVYKTRQRIKDRFCFGFYVTQTNLSFEPLMIKPSDPYFMFWLANMRPVVGGQAYWQMMQQNQWLTQVFPNLEPINRHSTLKRPNLLIKGIKLALEILFWLPVRVAEPFLRRIHVNHTFKLAENNTVTSTTIANKDMLKLHGYDVRAEIAQRFEGVLKGLR